jgi:hypothetical protein
MSDNVQDVAMFIIGASVLPVVLAIEWITARWRHSRTLAAATSPSLPRPLFGCFCDECQAASAGLRLASDQAAEPAPLPSHVGAYRTNPRQQPSLPRKAPWWRLAMWRFRDGPERLKVARTRRFLAKHYPSDGWQMRQGGAEVISAVTSIVSAVRVADSDTEVPVADVRLEGARMRLYDEDGESALLDWTLGAPRDASRKERASTEVDCPTCCAVSGEPCCLNEH